MAKDQGNIKKRGCPKYSPGQPQTEICNYCITALLH